LVFAATLFPLVVPGAALSKESKKKNANAEDAVTPPEDLMREHGVLDRVLLIYEAVLRNFDANRDFNPRLNKPENDKWSFCLTAGTLWPANQERP
jgi:hypothetical protein